jgi:hypothetical protein
VGVHAQIWPVSTLAVFSAPRHFAEQIARFGLDLVLKAGLHQTARNNSEKIPDKSDSIEPGLVRAIT